MVVRLHESLGLHGADRKPFPGRERLPVLPFSHCLGPGETSQLAEPRTWACGWKEMESEINRGWLAAGNYAGTCQPEGSCVTGSSSINL